MLENLSNILSPGVLEWVKPKKLIEAINNSFRLVAEVFRGHDAVVNTEYDHIGIRSQSLCVTIPMSDIIPATTIAGMDNVTTDTVAGENKESYKFFVRGLPKDLLAVGKSPDSDMALLYHDFIPYGQGYLFRANPVIVGTVDAKSGEVSVHFYCVGGSTKAKSQPQFRSLYKDTTNNNIVRVIDHSTNESMRLAGISNIAVHSAASVGTIVNDGVIDEYSWEEGSRQYICVGNYLYSCPKGMEINANTNKLSVGSPISNSHIDSTVVFPVGDAWYWADDRRIDHSLLPDDIFIAYPELAKDAPLLPQLRAIMKSRGIETIIVNDQGYKNNDLRVLNHSIPITGSLHIVKHLDIDISGVSTADPNAVDTLYLLYNDTGGYINQCNSAMFIRHAVRGTDGCMRVTKCVNNNGIVAGISCNSSITGVHPSINSKIYGVVTVIGGNTENEDIIYSYKNIEPVSFGPGLEVILTVIV